MSTRQGVRIWKPPRAHCQGTAIVMSTGGLTPSAIVKLLVERAEDLDGKPLDLA